MLLRHASERYPHDRSIFLALGRVWLESAQARSDRFDLNKALEALEKAVDDDSSSEACLLYGRALLLAADADSAERMLQQATRKLPADPLAFYYLADAAERRAPLRRRPAGAHRLQRTRRRRERRPPPAPISRSASPICRCASRTSPSPRPTTNAPRRSCQVTKRSSSSSRTHAGAPASQMPAKAILDKLLEKHPESVGARNLRARIR